MIREPVVAGQFYPASSSTLEKEIRQLTSKDVVRENAIGLVSPHAGYIFSGAVAGATLSRIQIKDTFVILGPNHTGMGQPFSILTEGYWRTPLGDVEIDTKLGQKILGKSNHLEEDYIAHINEHSIEVQIPFLQYFKRDVKIVPIVLAHSKIDIYKEIGKSIAEVIQESDSGVVIIASSDMTHYESLKSARQKDTKAINAILDLNEDELMKNVRDLNITMCGYAPGIALITAAKELGAQRTELIKYQTSGDMTNDYSRVVGYAGIIITR